MVPISAHALFARPLVISPTSVLAVEVLSRSTPHGRAVVRRPPDRRAAAGRAGRGPARGACRCGWPGCTTRRSPTGWSPSSPCRCWAGGAAPHAAARASAATVDVAGTRRQRPDLRMVVPVLEEMRIRSLGVIDDAVVELSPGFTAVTGETGAGKTMVVTSLGLLLGGRADPAAVRIGAEQRRRRGPARGRPDGPRRPRAVGGRRRARRRRAAHQPYRLGRGPLPGPSRRPRRCRSGCSPSSPTTSSPCTARPTSRGCSSRPGSARRSTGTPGDGAATPLATLPGGLPTAARGRGRARRADHAGPGARPGGRPAALRPRRDRGRRAAAGRGRRAAARRRSGSATPRRCRRRRHRARGAARRPEDSVDEGRDATTLVAAARAALEAVRPRTTRRWPRSPTGSARSASCSPTSRPSSPRTPSRSTPTRSGSPRSRSGAPRSTQLTRKYGDEPTVGRPGDAVLAWASGRPPG